MGWIEESGRDTPLQSNCLPHQSEIKTLPPFWRTLNSELWVAPRHCEVQSWVLGPQGKGSPGTTGIAWVESSFLSMMFSLGVVHLAAQTPRGKLKCQGYGRRTTAWGWLGRSKKSITIPSAITESVLIFKEVIGIGFSAPVCKGLEIRCSNFCGLQYFPLIWRFVAAKWQHQRTGPAAPVCQDTRI